MHAANGHRPHDVYRFFRDELSAEFMQFIPIVERVAREQWPAVEHARRNGTDQTDLVYLKDGEAVTSRSVKPAEYGAFLSAIFGQYLLCVHAPECGNALALMHNGDVYSCDHYVEPENLLGTVNQRSFQEMLVSPAQQEFGHSKRTALPTQCQRCPVRWACHGGCPKDRFIKTTDGEPGLNYLCDGYKQFFGHVQA
ncbi:MAG: SPASM domain-containing protein, partial [Microbacteriaceae bacterium]|nr:SPASM domain-containing protein [Microbacteriaceae bacterium]